MAPKTKKFLWGSIFGKRFNLWMAISWEQKIVRCSNFRTFISKGMDHNRKVSGQSERKTSLLGKPGMNSYKEPIFDFWPLKIWKKKFFQSFFSKTKWLPFPKKNNNFIFFCFVFFCKIGLVPNHLWKKQLNVTLFEWIIGIWKWHQKQKNHMGANFQKEVWSLDGYILETINS